MSGIIELMLQKKPFVSSGAATENQIKEAESKLGVKFSKEYKEYLSVFGTASYYGHELTGICADDASINVIDVTLAERSCFTNIPHGWYVIEQTHLDGIVIWQDEQGCIYKATPKKIIKSYDSLKEYIDME